MLSLKHLKASLKSTTKLIAVNIETNAGTRQPSNALLGKQTMIIIQKYQSDFSSLINKKIDTKYRTLVTINCPVISLTSWKIFCSK